MSILKPFLVNYEHEYQNTLKVLRAIPEDKFNFTPHEKMRPAGRLAWHIVRIEDILGRGALSDKIIADGGVPVNPPTTIHLSPHSLRSNRIAFTHSPTHSSPGGHKLFPTSVR